MINSQISDEYLIKCVKDGDIEKVATLFDRHHQKIHSYFYRLTRCGVESEDLTQNVFVRIISFRNSYKLGHQFLPWIFRIAHNVFIDHCKFKNKEVNCLNYFENISIDEEDNEAKSDQLDRFYIAFTSLPIEYRELLIMSRYNDLTYKQIGEVLGISERAVRQKAFRAIVRLRKEYEKVL